MPPDKPTKNCPWSWSSTATRMSRQLALQPEVQIGLCNLVGAAGHAGELPELGRLTPKLQCEGTERQWGPQNARRNLNRRLITWADVHRAIADKKHMTPSMAALWRLTQPDCGCWTSRPDIFCCASDIGRPVTWSRLLKSSPATEKNYLAISTAWWGTLNTTSTILMRPLAHYQGWIRSRSRC